MYLLSIIKIMNKYILIHKLINYTIYMLFPITALYILNYNRLNTGIYGIIYLIFNIIEIILFISFIIISLKCEWGTRKQHAIVKGIISSILYIIIIIFSIISFIN